MGLLAIDLHDVETIACPAAGRGEVRLPAVVRLDGDELLVGEPALRGARYLPRQVHDRFYEELALEPLEHPFPGSWRTADLAHAHLQELRRLVPAADAVILLTGGLDENRLPVLLGIAGSLGLPVAGLAPSGLACAAAGFPGPATGGVHLELYRHRAVATSLRRQGDAWSVDGVEVDHGISWKKLQKAQLDAVSRAFVRATRYDPLASAEGEQQLHNRWPGWQAALERSESVDARLGTGASIASIELTRSELVEAAAPTARRLAELAAGGTVGAEAVRADTVLLGTHAAAPAIRQAMARSGLDPRVLDQDAACRGALQAARDILDAGPGLFLQRLPGAA